MVKHANLEIERAKSISDQRLEGYRILKQATDVFQAKVDTYERELNVLIGNYKGDNRIEGELRGLLKGLGEMRTVLKEDVRKIYIEEPFALLGEIHGTDGNFLRLQSAFRELERENQVLKERYIKWQTSQPSLTISEDKERIISSLRSQIASLTNEISSLKAKSQVSVNVQGNTQEYEIKIRTLNSKIQELESQLRTQKVDYEGQLRTKNTTIRELEEQIATIKTTGSTLIPGSTSILKPEDSRVTGTPYGTSSSNIDRMSSSVTSSSSSLSGTGLSTSQYGSSSESGARYSSSTYQPAQYGASGVTSYGATTSGVTGTTPVTTYGTSSGTSYGTSGTTGITGVTGTTSTYGTGSGHQASSTGSTGATGYQSYFSKYAKGGNWSGYYSLIVYFM